MADDRHLEKSKNCHISAMIGPIGTKCRTMTYIGLFNPKNR